VKEAEVIKNWLSQFDSVIDNLASDPARVKRDELLLLHFTLAYPPEGLPSRLKFKGGDESVDFEEIIREHRPYYVAHTRTRKELNHHTGTMVTTAKTLTLRLIDPKPSRQLLAKFGILTEGNDEASTRRA
jgi:hypothetical protein